MQVLRERMEIPMLGIRAAKDTDSPAVVELVRTVLLEYGLEPAPEGIDADLPALEASYDAVGGWFEVLVEDGIIRGTVGVIPLSQTVCELRKMYFHPSIRGRGLGRALLDRTLRKAQAAGFEQVRLETASQLVEAISLYRSVGFMELDERIGVPRCDRAFYLELDGFVGAEGLPRIDPLEN
jgi:putative acetyltransferase